MEDLFCLECSWIGNLDDLAGNGEEQTINDFIYCPDCGSGRIVELHEALPGSVIILAVDE